MRRLDTMFQSPVRLLTQRLYEDRNLRFWFCQFIGWSGYSILTFLSITLVDDQVSWPHLGHIILSAILGALTSWPLRPLYRKSFDSSLLSRLIIAAAAVLISSGVWTVLRIVVFAWIVGEPAIWNEFNYWYFGSLFVFLSWTVLYYGIQYYELHALEQQKLIEASVLKDAERIRRIDAEYAARSAQLQMLRYQLNPHFLFNTLNAINSLVRLGENDKAQEMLLFLGEFLRHSLEQDGIENVCLDEELKSLTLYLNIEKARFEDRLTVLFDIEPESRRALVPGMILQPIIENSMKYAIAESEAGGTVRVKASVSEDALQLEVSDTGPGMDAQQGPNSRGVGLQNIMDRLKTLYGSKFVFEARNTAPSGLAVRIRIPLETPRVAGQAR